MRNKCIIDFGFKVLLQLEKREREGKRKGCLYLFASHRSFSACNFQHKKKKKKKIGDRRRKKNNNKKIKIGYIESDS